MRFSARTWSLLSLLLFVAAVFFWLKGNELEARKRLAPPVVVSSNTPKTSIDLFSTRTTSQLASLTRSADSNAASGQITEASLTEGQVDQDAIDKKYPYRLRNTRKPLRELVRDEKAVLLANALIDTGAEAPRIPEHLRAEAD